MEETEFVKQVPSNVIGFIIGRKSWNIDRIARECDVKIRVLRRRNEMPKIQRIEKKIPIVLNGTTKSVLEALTMIDNRIQEHEIISARQNTKKPNKASSTYFSSYSSENNCSNDRISSSASENNDSEIRKKFNELCRRVMQNELDQWPSNVDYREVPPEFDFRTLEKSKCKKPIGDAEPKSNSRNEDYEGHQTKTSSDNMADNANQCENIVVEVNEVACHIYGENTLLIRDTRLTYTEKIAIKNDLIALAIGTGGKNINKARSIEGIVKVTMFGEKELCIVEGRNYEAVKKARSVLEYSKEIFEIPREYVYRIFNRYENRKYLEKITDVRIEVIMENMDTVGLVQLKGTVCNMARAKLILLDKYPELYFILKNDSTNYYVDFFKRKLKDLAVNVYTLNHGKFKSEHFFIIDVIDPSKVLLASNEMDHYTVVNADYVKLPYDGNANYNFVAGDYVKIRCLAGLSSTPLTDSTPIMKDTCISVKILSVCRESNSVKYFFNGQVWEVPFDYVGDSENEIAFYKFRVKIPSNFSAWSAYIFCEFLTAIEASYCFLDKLNSSLEIISRLSWTKEKTIEIYPLFARLMMNNATRNSEMTVAELFSCDVTLFGAPLTKTTYALLSERMKNLNFYFPTTLTTTLSDPPSSTAENLSGGKENQSVSCFDSRLKNPETKSETVSSEKLPEKNFQRKYSGVKIVPRESPNDSKTTVPLSTSASSRNALYLSSRSFQSITKNPSSSKDTDVYPARKLSHPYDPQKATRKLSDSICCLS